MSRPPADVDRLRAEYRARRRRLAGQDIYSLFNPGHLFMIQNRQRAVLALLRREGFFPLAGRRVLEVGCGDGGVLREFLAYGATPARLHGVDLLGWRLARGQPGLVGVPLTHADGRRLPFPVAHFDLVMQFTMFTSVLDPVVKRTLAAEMRRVLRPGGLILWYDYWLNPTNPQARGIRPAEIRMLFPGCHCHFVRITLAPPLARRLAPRAWLLCCILESLQVFNTHYLVAIRTPELGDSNA